MRGRIGYKARPGSPPGAASRAWRRIRGTLAAVSTSLALAARVISEGYLPSRWCAGLAGRTQESDDGQVFRLVAQAVRQEWEQ